MFRPEHRNNAHETLRETVSRADFERGKAGCKLPEDLEAKKQLYTLRRLLPWQDRDDQQYAEDLPVHVVKVSPQDGGMYFLIPVKAVYRNGDRIEEDPPIDCIMSLDGSILNTDVDTCDVEVGYLLPGERMTNEHLQHSVELEPIPLKRIVPEPLKYFTFDD